MNRDMTMNKNFLVTKSNKLITASYDLTTQEQKIILILASMVQPEDTEFKEYEFKIKDFVELLGVEDKKKYIEIPNITKKLMKKVLEVRENNEIIQLSWLSSARYKIGQGIVILKFDSTLKPYLLQLKKLYTTYKVDNILNLKSKYSIRIYEFLRSNLYKNIVNIDIEDMKEMLGIKNKSYNVYANLKNKVILKAQQEVNSLTDIKFSFEEIKTGRKVTSITFNVSSKSNDVAILPNILPKEILPEEQEDPLLENVKKIFYKHEITSKEAMAILNKSKNLQYISECYNYALTKNVKNIVGYIITLMDNFQKPQCNNKIQTGNFNNFEQRDYNFDELEKKLLGWD